MRGVALNFFPLTTSEFRFRLFSSPFVEGERPTVDGKEAVSRSLNVGGTREQYWTLLQPTEGFSETECSSFENVYATLDVLRNGLLDRCRTELQPTAYDELSGFRPRVEIVLARFTEGKQVVSVEPYYLRAKRLFGFLADFQFRPEDQHRQSRRALQLSLSLDKNGRENRDYYSDRYSKLTEFVEGVHPRIFPLPAGQNLTEPVEVEAQLVELEPGRLDRKHYVVGAGREVRSQFAGVKSSGPLTDSEPESRLHFLFRSEDRALAHGLYRALGGQFSTFPGMERMFHFPISRENVTGTVIKNFEPNEISRARDLVVREAAGRKVVPVVLTPFSKFDEPDANAAYWLLKHAFLSAELPMQAVFTGTLAERNTLKWSVSGIGLQIFAKAGGTPWKVRPRTERCLVVGIGQAHRKVGGEIRRFYAYSVLSDASGVFEEVRVLGDDTDESAYLETFAESLRSIFADYSSRFSNFVVHTTFAIRRAEVEKVEETLEAQRRCSESGDFVVMKFNRRSRFFGFAIEHNSRVPFESTTLRLSKKDFLVWFEGLNYGRSTVHKRIGRPLHVQFSYPDDLLPEQRRSYLQDAINLSGANWRGFNAKAVPVSVYYAQLIARYIRQFEALGLGPVNVNILAPWFL